MRRLIQIRRRRGTVDPITAAYDQILATSPTVPVLFLLTSYRGQQVLFQDAACTIPVESIGDPIGGIRHPLTGEIIAVQTVDANRPVWGGVEVGAVFTGTETLVGESPFVPETADFRAIVGVGFESSLPAGSTFISQYTSGIVGRMLMFLLDATGETRFQTAAVFRNITLPGAGDYSISFRRTSGEGSVRGMGDGYSETSGSTTLSPILQVDTVIGASSVTSPMVGSMRGALFYHGATPESTETQALELLL